MPTTTNFGDRPSGLVDRRGALKCGMLGAGALALPQVLRAEQGNPAAKRQHSVILLHMRGGPSQLDTWDMKPHAPVEYRGEFNPISTAVPDIQICELLPQTSAMMNKWSIVRSVQHPADYGDVSHPRGNQVVFTGYPPGPNEMQNAYPSVGSVVARQLQHLDRSMLAHVLMPRILPGAGAAYLGQQYEPFVTEAPTAVRGQPFSVPNLSTLPEMSGRMVDRRRLLTALDGMRRDADRNGMMEAMDAYHQQAWELVTGDRVRNAFDLDAEPASLRERYGFPPKYVPRSIGAGNNPGWNQRLLLARRLVEAGVRIVTLEIGWWDTHEDNFFALKNCFLPMWDQCYSALIEDLDQRGLLETTLVLAYGEHGRTPRINRLAGRDHWMSAFSAALAGGGVQGGRVVGSTDTKAEMVSHNAKYPHDLLATIYRHLGVDTNLSYNDHAGRPHPVLPFGHPIDELF